MGEARTECYGCEGRVRWEEVVSLARQYSMAEFGQPQSPCFCSFLFLFLFLFLPFYPLIHLFVLVFLPLLGLETGREKCLTFEGVLN